MIKMTRVYGDMYVPREYCTFTNPVTSGGTEEVDYVDMPCENGCEKECENCTLQKIMNEYARLTRQDIDEKKRHCEECENYTLFPYTTLFRSRNMQDTQTIGSEKRTSESLQKIPRTK
mgnify:CR=1 FL=1